MSVEEDNGRERGEEKQEKNGNRKEYGYGTKMTLFRLGDFFS